MLRWVLTSSRRLSSFSAWLWVVQPYRMWLAWPKMPPCQFFANCTLVQDSSPGVVRCCGRIGVVERTKHGSIPALANIPYSEKCVLFTGDDEVETKYQHCFKRRREQVSWQRLVVGQRSALLQLNPSGRMFTHRRELQDSCGSVDIGRRDGEGLR